MKAANRRIDLDVVRGLAILLAMGWHLNSLPVTGPGAILMAPGRTIGWAGVDLFFVLSGFLIGRLIIAEVQHHGDFHYRLFLIRRVLRLWPVVYVFLLAMIAAHVAPWRDFAWQIALHVQNFVPTKSATHLWSLAVEEHFYLLLGAAFPLVLLRTNWRHALPLSLLIIIAVCPILRWLAVSAEFSPTAVQVQTQFRLDALASGVLLAYISREAPDVFARLLSARWAWALATVAGGTFLWFVPKHTVLGQVEGFSVAWMTAVALLMLLYKSGIEGFLRWPALLIAFIGQVSYPLYLWHVAAFKIGSKQFEARFGQDMPGVETLAIYIAAVVIAAAFTFALEHPLMAIRDKYYPARSRAVPTQSLDATAPSLRQPAT